MHQATKTTSDKCVVALTNIKQSKCDSAVVKAATD